VLDASNAQAAKTNSEDKVKILVEVHDGMMVLIS